MYLRDRKDLKLLFYEFENKWEEVNLKGRKGVRLFRDLNFMVKGM